MQIKRPLSMQHQLLTRQYLFVVHKSII